MKRSAIITALALTLALVGSFDSRAAQAQNGNFELQKIAGGSHYSPRLKARFIAQYMSIPGHSFWGARIVDIDFDSPLKHVGLHVGDVVTRLDGVSVTTGKIRVNDWNGTDYYQLPQMEKHYSQTRVRFIKTGTQMVREGFVNLGPLHACGTSPGGVCNNGGGIAP